MTLMITVGQYGGFYFDRGWGVRICLGWVALTWWPRDADDMLERFADYAEAKEAMRR